MKPQRKKLRKVVRILAGIAVGLVAAFLLYFPGRQAPMAFTLATGIGVDSLQARVDRMEEKAIHGNGFTDSDKEFLRNLYTCFAKGGRLTVVLRQSSEMMSRYLSATGEDLKTDPRIFINSAPVLGQMAMIRQQIVNDVRGSGKVKAAYQSDTFYMGDPTFFDSFVGLYFGRVTAAPDRAADGKLTIRWRAECPWLWPSYASLFEKYGQHHAQCFPLPNAMSIVLGPRYCLRIDDGLGGHLVSLGLANSFLVCSEWREDVGTGQ